MHVLGVLSFVVERVGVAIRPHASALVQYLPLLWAESADHNMLRCAIVSTLVHLVKVSNSVQQKYILLLNFILLSEDKERCNVTRYGLTTSSRFDTFE